MKYVGAGIGAITGLVIAGGIALLGYLSRDPSVNVLGYCTVPVLATVGGALLGHEVQYQDNSKESPSRKIGYF